MSDYHEPVEELQPLDRDISRALSSLKEEIEAINWYHQRVAACADPELKKILAHNRDEEMEHAAMALEWLRRIMPEWDEALKTYLFTTQSITEIEEGAEDNEKSSSQPKGLGIGSLKRK